MVENIKKCEKGEFIDEVFGDKIEYVKIFDEKGITLIFGMDNQIIVKNFKNTKELIEKFIEKYIECEYTDNMWQEIDNDRCELYVKNEYAITNLKKMIKYLEGKEDNLCDNCRNMEE